MLASPVAVSAACHGHRQIPERNTHFWFVGSEVSVLGEVEHRAVGACDRGGCSPHGGQEAGVGNERGDWEKKASKNKVPSRAFPVTCFCSQTPPPNVPSLKNKVPKLGRGGARL